MGREERGEMSVDSYPDPSGSSEFRKCAEAIARYAALMASAGDLVAGEWRCRVCRTLLAVCNPPEVHLRYKRIEQSIGGMDFYLRTRCPQCGAENVTRRRSKYLP
jgi:hypothetical protein